MDDVKLLPCPFCGGPAEVERPGTMRQSMIVVCQDCGARVESGDVTDLTRADSLAWNMRQEVVARALVRQLHAVVEDFMPNIGKCVLQDYKRLNDTLVEARKFLGED